MKSLRIVAQHCCYGVFSCSFPFPSKDFCVSASEIYGPCDLLLLSASCCTWHTWIFVISVEEQLLNGPSGFERVPVSNLSFFYVCFKGFSNPGILVISKLNIYEILSCISKTEIIGKCFTILHIHQFFPLLYFSMYNGLFYMSTHDVENS